MSVYRVTDLIGTSTTSWEDAAAGAIRTAGKSLRELRVAEVVQQDQRVIDELVRGPRHQPRPLRDHSRELNKLRIVH